MGEYFDPFASFDERYKMGYEQVSSEHLNRIVHGKTVQPSGRHDGEGPVPEKSDEPAPPLSTADQKTDEPAPPLSAADQKTDRTDPQPAAASDGLDELPHQSVSARKGNKVYEIPPGAQGIFDERAIPVTRQEGKDSHRHHHHHHHHRKGPIRRLRHWYREHRVMVSVVLLMLLAACAAGGYVVYKQTVRQKRQHISSTHSYDMGSGYRVIEYEGKKYRYNNLITTFLYAGIDSSGPMRTYSIAGEGPLADSISLAVLDKKNSRMSVISINRYTLTRILRYSAFFEDSDYYDSMICYTFAFGDGGKRSCDNLKESVSYLLGIPIDEYLITNLDSMTYINDIVGGVTVTVPNDTVAEVIPGAVKGSTLDITSENVMAYLRTRDIHTYFSNDDRLERQKSYILAYMDKLRAILPDHRGEVWDRLEEMEQFLLTSVTKNKYLQYAKLFSTVDFTEENFYNLPGYNQRGMYYDEFVPDHEEIKKLVLDLFYEPI